MRDRNSRSGRCEVPIQWNREADHGPVARAGFDETLALQLLGTVLHAGHTMPAIEAAVELHRDALAVVLDDDLEVAFGDRAAHGAARSAAVLDDVADGLAQHARGLHERAR